MYPISLFIFVLLYLKKYHSVCVLKCLLNYWQQIQYTKHGEGEFIKKNLRRCLVLDPNNAILHKIVSQIPISTYINEWPTTAVNASLEYNFVVKEELLDLVALQESTTSVDIKNALDSMMKTFVVPLNKLVSIVIDGVPTMSDKNWSYRAFKK